MVFCMKKAVSKILIALMLSFLLANVGVYSEGVETFKHHIWKINKASFSINIDAIQPVVEEDLNTLGDFMEKVIGALKNGEIHIYVGNKTPEGDAIYAAPFFRLMNKIQVYKDVYLALKSMAKWSENEIVYMDEDIASELEFYIPEESVFVV